MKSRSYVNDTGYSDFGNLFKEGIQGEGQVADWLRARGNTEIETIEEAMEKDSSLKKEYWDLRCINKDGTSVSFEVKTQNYCHQHFGVNIEETQSGVDSGIRVSKADFYLFVNPKMGIGVIHTSFLKDSSKTEKMMPFVTKAKNKATGFILPHAYIKWFKI